jgi:hypothetical protein
LFIPTSAIILSIIAAGLPGALLAGIVTWWRRRHLYGAIPGWFYGLLGAVLGLFAVKWWESSLPHHEVRDVFGPAWVADYPSERVLITIRIVCSLIGSALLGLLCGLVFPMRRSRKNDHGGRAGVE